MKSFLVGATLLISLSVHAQELQEVQDSLVIDNRYLEDQFYLGVTYNFLLQQPGDLSQRNLSYGLQGGFIKDIPLNRDRTAGLGIGLGYGLYSYYSDLIAAETPDGITYEIDGSRDGFRRSKIETHLVEMPIQFRWRTSTATEYRFYRIYAGLKLGYLLGARSKFVSDTGKITFNNTDIREFQYGISLNLGYDSFNVHAYYMLNNLFNNGVQVNGDDIGLRPLRIGFIFYIL